MVLVLVVALDAVAHAGDASSALTGGAMLLLAAFAPYAVLRLVPVAEVAVTSHLEGLRQRAVGTAARTSGRAVTLALAGASLAKGPPDGTGTDPIPMAKGEAVDLVAGTSLDPDASFKRGRLPVTAVPASAGRHVWERDACGPRLVWKAPWDVDDD